MWPLYISQAEKHDLQLVERWKKQTDTMINGVCTVLLYAPDIF